MNGAKYPRLLTFASVVVVVAALYFAKVILVPLAIAFLLAFLLSPLVNRMRKLGLPRIVAVIAVMLLSLAFACGLGWVVVNQTQQHRQQAARVSRRNLQEKVATFARPPKPVQQRHQDRHRHRQSSYGNEAGWPGRGARGQYLQQSSLPRRDGAPRPDRELS